MGQVGDAYAGCRGRLTELTLSLDPPRAQVRVPACPQWSVHDVLAHVAGVVDDALAGRLDGVATDPWTDAQVQARRAMPTARVVAEWNEKAPAFEELLDPIGAPGRQAVADVVTHEHDVRAALGLPGARDSDAVRIGFEFVADAMVGFAGGQGLSFAVEPASGPRIGDAGAGTVVRGEPFELLRAMTGRRSVAQLSSLDIDGDVERLLPCFTFGPFRPAAHDIDE